MSERSPLRFKGVVSSDNPADAAWVEETNRRAHEFNAPAFAELARRKAAADNNNEIANPPLQGQEAVASPSEISEAATPETTAEQFKDPVEQELPVSETESAAFKEEIPSERYGPELPIQTFDSFKQRYDALNADENLDSKGYLEKLSLMRDGLRSQIAKQVEADAPARQQLAQVRSNLGIPRQSDPESKELQSLRTLSREMRDQIALENMNLKTSLETQGQTAEIPETVNTAPEESVFTPEPILKPESKEKSSSIIDRMSNGIRAFATEANSRAERWDSPTMDPFMTKGTQDKFTGSAEVLSSFVKNPETATPEALIEQMNLMAEAFGEMKKTKEGTQMIDTSESLAKLQAGLRELGMGIEEMKKLYPDRADVTEASDKLFAVAQDRWRFFGDLKQSIDNYHRL